MHRILVVDDQSVVRIGMAGFVRLLLPSATVAEAENAHQAMDYIQKHTWDLIILDIQLPDRSGLDLLPDINLIQPEASVLFLTGLVDKSLCLRAWRNGAKGLLTKNATRQELQSAIQTILGGKRYIGPDMAEWLVSYAMDPNTQNITEKLSDREFQVLCLMGQGKSATDIATSLSLSIKTVSTYRSRILDKMGLKNTAEAIRYAIEHGLVK